MLIKLSDGRYACGPLDVWTILRDVKTGRFHTVFLQEIPMPGPVPDPAEMKFVRLRSAFHHTSGFEKLEEAQADLEQIKNGKMVVTETNIWSKVHDWNGETGFTWIVAPWWK